MIKIAENKYKFDVNCDLTSYMIMRAQDWIVSELNPDFDTKKKLNFEVVVASQNMAEAIKLAYCLGYSIKVNFDYGEDEWSLDGYYYTTHPEEFKKVGLTVWSPGA